jgi:hypothetical protein
MLAVLLDHVQHVTERGFFSDARKLREGLDGLFDYFGAVLQVCEDTELTRNILAGRGISEVQPLKNLKLSSLKMLRGSRFALASVSVRSKVRLYSEQLCGNEFFV